MTVRASRITMRAELLERLISRWDSDRMCRHRTALATHLETVVKTGADNEPQPDNAVKWIADFFEEMGIYFHRRHIDRTITWELFFDPAFVYWQQIAKQYASDSRSADDQTPYRYFEYMVGEMGDTFYRQSTTAWNADIYVTSDDLLAFLREEKEIATDRAGGRQTP